MAYDSIPVKFTYHFDLLGGAGAGGDIAEFSLWFASLAGLPPDVDAALLSTAQAVHDAWVAHTDTGDWPAALELSYVEGAQYDLSGNTQAVQRYVPGTGWAGTQSGSLPWQCALVVGVYSYTPGTFIPNARRRRGRVYLPPFRKDISDVAGTGGISTSLQDSYMNLVRECLAAGATSEVWGPSADSGLDPSVNSRAAQHLYSVTDITTDGVIDTQRRRSNREARTRRSISYHV